MSEPNDFPEIMDLKQAAKYLGMGESTLYRKLKKGEIPGAKKIGVWKISKKVLDESFGRGEGA